MSDTTAAREKGASAAPATGLPPLEGATRIIGYIALSTAVFMNVLDTSIANVSIPTTSGDLGVSSSQGTWVITSFAVANAITVPLTGWLTQRFGQVRLFLTSTPIVRAGIVAVRLCVIIRSLDRVPCAARGGGGPDDSLVPSVDAFKLPQIQGGDGASRMVYDDLGCAGCRTPIGGVDIG